MKYIAHATLTHKGDIIRPGDEVDLTQKQADALGDKVEKKNSSSKSSKTSRSSDTEEDGPSGYKTSEKDTSGSNNDET